VITKGEEIQILIYPHLFLSQPNTILAQILIYRSSNMHLFLSNSILPFTQTLSFLSYLYSTICSTPTFFCLHPILSFAQTPPFFVINLFYHLFNSHIILSGSYSTVRSNPIFFCQNSILLFDPLPFFSVSILFYRSLNHHLFLS